MDLFKSSSKFSKKHLILLSIPVFFSNLAIPLVGIVDTGLMGNLGETKYLAAASLATSVMTMIIWSFGFLRMGTVGIVSQAFGRGDYREIVKTLLRNFIIAIIIAFLIASKGFDILYLFLLADLFCCAFVLTTFYSFFDNRIDEKIAYFSIIIGLIGGVLLFPTPDFSKSLLVGLILSKDLFTPFINQSLLFLSFLIATFLPLVVLKITKLK